jgi:hypothetical protein
MRPIDKFILHVVHNLVPLNEYNEGILNRLMNHYKEEADDLNIEINDEQLKKYIERFDTLKPSIIAKGGTELFKQVGGEKKIEVIVPLSQLIKIVTSSKGVEAVESADITPDVVYHNEDDTIIVYNGSKEDNCIRYGRGERWCITKGSYGNYRYNESKSFPTFYLAQNDNLSSDNSLSFVAIQVRNPQTTSENERYVYTNRKNSPYESRPMSFNQLEREIPWLREIPNVREVLKYIPLSTGEKITQQYKNTPIGIREWVKLPFNVKQQYLVVRTNRTLFNDISNDDFVSKYLSKFPQLAEFVATNYGVIESELLLKNLESFSNKDRKSIIANMRDKVDLSYLKKETLPFDVKKLLVTLDKWNLKDNERIYTTQDGNAIVKLTLDDNITAGIYTAEDDYPSIKLNKRTSKYITEYPELDKIPFNSLIKLVSNEVIDQTLLDQVLEKAKTDPNSAIIVKDTDSGQIIVDSNSFASYKIENGKISQIPFDSEEVQSIFNDQEDNESFQQNILNLFDAREDIPSEIDRVGLTSILNSTPYTRRIITPDYLNRPVVILTTSNENPIIFTAAAGPNVSGDNIFSDKISYGRRNDWRDASSNERFTPEMVDAYFAYLRGTNLAFSDQGLINALSAYGMSTDIKKFILTNPNLPLQDTNIYRPAEYDDTAYLVNTQNPADSKKISNNSGKLIKANITANAARRLLRAQQPEPEAPAAEPGAEVEPAVAQLQALAAQGGERRRGRPAGVPNAPREPRERQRGNVSVPEAFDERGLFAGFRTLPRNDQRRLNVDDAVALNRIGDRGASARDNLLAGQGRVTNVVSVGPSKIYFIRLNNDTRIASINIQPGNRNYVITGDRSYSLNSPRELVSFLQQRNILEALRTSLVKLHLQENPHMIEEMKNLKNNLTMKEAYSTEESFKDYSDDALTDMIINSSRFEGNEEGIERIKQELKRRKQSKNMKLKEFKSLVREVVRKKLAENQPAPARETPGRETETIPDRGTEEEKKRRRIGNPDKMPKKTPAKATATMNENEQEIIKQIVARFKSKK